MEASAGVGAAGCATEAGGQGASPAPFSSSHGPRPSRLIPLLPPPTPIRLAFLPSQPQRPFLCGEPLPWTRRDAPVGAGPSGRPPASERACPGGGFEREGAAGGKLNPCRLPPRAVVATSRGEVAGPSRAHAREESGGERAPACVCARVGGLCRELEFTTGLC